MAAAPTPDIAPVDQDPVAPDRTSSGVHEDEHHADQATDDARQHPGAHRDPGDPGEGSDLTPDEGQLLSVRTSGENAQVHDPGTSPAPTSTTKEQA